MKVWLVTWEGYRNNGGSSALDQKEATIAAIYSPYLREKGVSERVEQLYVATMLSVLGQAEYIRDRKHNPFSTKVRLSPYSIVCGHDPWLEARKVSHFKVYLDPDGNEVVSWLEPMANGKSKKKSLTIER